LHHLLLFTFLLVTGAKSDDFDPGAVLLQCLDEGNSPNGCSKNVIEEFTKYMDTGLPHLGLKPMDPLRVPQIDFTFFDATVELTDVVLKGFQENNVKFSEIDREARTWRLGFHLPSLDSSGVYKLYGTIPPNLDLGTSTGDIRLTADKVDMTIEMGLGAREDGNLEAKTFDLILDLDDINVEMECLFPKSNGRCCPRKFLKSCKQILAKTVLRFINNDGKKFIKDFQPEIARQTGEILKDYMNSALGSVKAEKIIDI